MTKSALNIPQECDGTAYLTKTLSGYEFKIPISEDCTSIIYRWYEGSLVIHYWEIKGEEPPAEVVEVK